MLRPIYLLFLRIRLTEVEMKELDHSEDEGSEGDEEEEEEEEA